MKETFHQKKTAAVPGTCNREDLYVKHLHKTEPSRNGKTFRSLAVALQADFAVFRYT